MDKYVIIDGLRFQLNSIDYTASIKESQHIKSDILIPRSIIYESNEYIITSIQQYSFLRDMKIKSIRFAQNSEVHTIEHNAFFYSSISSIVFPESIEKLQCFSNSTPNLNFVSIPASNSYFFTINNSLLIGKNDPFRYDFDSLLFVSRNITKLTVPSFIKYINSYSFADCHCIQKVEFSEDSELVSIDENAFEGSSIQFLIFPPKLEHLHDRWCNYTVKLNIIKISPENKNFCYLDDEQKIILGKTKDTFDVILFGSRDIKQVVIPNCIKRIGKYAFANCSSLEKVVISKDSELEIIGSSSFYFSMISDIYIPKHVKIIENSSFCSCRNLKLVEFDVDSELEIIDENAFNNSFISDIINIPVHVKEIRKSAFCDCEFLYSVKFDENIEIKSIGDFSFAYSNILSIVIPKSLKVISSNAFSKCKLLEKIEFQKDSQLELICDGAFSETSIQEITIPKHVKKIGKKAFYFCESLTKLNFEEGSEIHSICKSAFYCSGLNYLEIPESLVDLQEGWCNGTEYLSKVQISPKNKNFTYYNQEMVIAKSDPNNDCYDTIIFVNHYISELIIPSFIKYIKSYAFSSILDIRELQFCENSQLLSIDRNAFKVFCIESFHIPEFLEELKDGWCIHTAFLYDITISEKNKNFRFLDSDKKIVVGKSNKENEIFDVITFACRNVKNAFIPSFINAINSGAFSECAFLNHIEFSDDSELQFIGKYSFSQSSIRNICIPKNVEIIGKSSFLYCIFLFSFEALAENFTFSDLLFSNCKRIKMIAFPNAYKIHKIKNVVLCFDSSDDIMLFICSNALID